MSNQIINTYNNFKTMFLPPNSFSGRGLCTILPFFPKVPMAQTDIWTKIERNNGKVTKAHAQEDFSILNCSVDITSRERDGSYLLKRQYEWPDRGDIFTLTSTHTADGKFLHGYVKDKTGTIVSMARRNKKGNVKTYIVRYVNENGTQRRILPLSRQMQLKLLRLYKSMKTILLMKLSRIKH